MSEELYQIMNGVSEAASAPLCKLIDAVRSGIGFAYEPTHVRRMARAESEALIINAQTEIALSELSQRAAARLTNTELRRQANVESVVRNAAEELPDEVSETPVDQDWLADFFDSCKDVGDEIVQKLWGKLLAGEVAEPESVSRRTIHALKIMSTSEAATFHCLSYRIWRLNDWPVLLVAPHDYSGKGWTPVWPYQWRHISTLVDAGIAEDDPIEGMQLSAGDFSLDYHGSRFVSRSVMGVRFVNLTSVGNELLRTVEPEAGLDDEFYKHICETLLKYSWSKDDSSEFRFYSLTEETEKIIDMLNWGTKTGSA